MSKRRLVITAVLSGLSQSEVARRYGVSQGWISRLMARYRTEGEAAFEARSRRPNSNPSATAPEVVDLVIDIRRRLRRAGLDAGAQTPAWHLEHTHHTSVSRPTINRILTRAHLVTPEPKKRPKSSYTRFEADQPNQTWQSDFTHYRLTRPDGTPGPDVEIIAWLDDHSRFLLHACAHRRVTAQVVHTTFRQAGDLHGYPASTLTDNGMVYTVRLAGTKNRGGRTALEAELHHPTTQGKIERLWQTLKKWPRAQPGQLTTIAELQTLLEDFTGEYNHRRPHRSLPHRATPATTYTTGIKATPHTDRTTDSHDRVRTDRIDTSGVVTLRVAGKLRHIGIGRTHARTHVKLLVHDLDVTVIDHATSQILRELTIDATRDYQPTGRPHGPAHTRK